MRLSALALVGVVLPGCMGSPPPSAGNSRAADRKADERRALQADGPPVTRRQEVVDLYHGVSVIDPFRWLESESDERARWFAAQNAYARRVLLSIPGRDALRSEIREANRSVERVQVLRLVGKKPRLFVLRRGGQDESLSPAGHFSASGPLAPGVSGGSGPHQVRW